MSKSPKSLADCINIADVRQVARRRLPTPIFDYLEGGESLDEFLHQFPSVKREFAIAVLDAAYETVAADANIA